MWQVYEYIDHRGYGVITAWDLDPAQRAKLDNKVHMLATAGSDLPPRLLAPLREHLWKLKVRGNVELRPILCKGPIQNDQEFTFLAQAVERDRKLLPDGVIRMAVERRLQIIGDLGRRRLLCRAE